MHLEALPDNEHLRGHLPMPKSLVMNTENRPDNLTSEILQKFPSSASEFIPNSLSLQINNSWHRYHRGQYTTHSQISF